MHVRLLYANKVQFRNNQTADVRRDVLRRRVVDDDVPTPARLRENGT